MVVTPHRGQTSLTGPPEPSRAAFEVISPPIVTGRVLPDNQLITTLTYLAHPRREPTNRRATYPRRGGSPPQPSPRCFQRIRRPEPT